MAMKLETVKARGLTDTGGDKLLLLDPDRVYVGALELAEAFLELLLRSVSICIRSCAFSRRRASICIAGRQPLMAQTCFSNLNTCLLCGYRYSLLQSFTPKIARVLFLAGMEAE